MKETLFENFENESLFLSKKLLEIGFIFIKTALPVLITFGSETALRVPLIG